MPDKILIVDDDPDFRQELKDFLEGYEVVEASDGHDAINILKRANEIGLVILDVMMPGLSGTKVLREIKRIDPKLHTIILTGYSTKDVVVEALKGHADDFIEKPLDLDKIKEIVDKVANPLHGTDEGTGGDMKAKINRIKQFIERNCLRKTVLTDLASSLCLSPKYVSRIFKQYTGKSYSEYRLEVKMKKAKELLRYPGYNINQISEKLGYENAESFIRQFKRYAKHTPTEYRKRLRKKAGK